MNNIDNLEYENKLISEGYSFICGTDEVGRGPLIGPVVAAAVIMPMDEIIEGVTDSKKIPEKKRIELEESLKELDRRIPEEYEKVYWHGLWRRRK